MQVRRKASCKKCTLRPTTDNLELVKSGVKCHPGVLTVVFKWLIKYSTLCYKDFKGKLSKQGLQAPLHD